MKKQNIINLKEDIESIDTLRDKYQKYVFSNRFKKHDKNEQLHLSNALFCLEMALVQLRFSQALFEDKTR